VPRVRDMITIESFHMNCQRRILGIRWHDFVRNSEVSLRTGLAPASDRITRGRNAIFGHVARLPDNIPAHQAMLREVGDAENARHEIAGHENAAPECRGGKCET